MIYQVSQNVKIHDISHLSKLKSIKNNKIFKVGISNLELKKKNPTGHQFLSPCEYSNSSKTFIVQTLRLYIKY